VRLDRGELDPEHLTVAQRREARRRIINLPACDVGIIEVEPA
jgi:hypothetical protein